MNRPTENTQIMLLISDPDMRSVLRDTLAAEGYLVRVAGEIGAAVDRLKESKPDLLIIRPYINSMPGHEAAKYLRTKCPGLRVMMVGGLIDDVRLAYSEALENIDIFPKPFTPAQFLQSVAEVLKGGHSK